MTAIYAIVTKKYFSSKPLLLVLILFINNFGRYLSITNEGNIAVEYKLYLVDNALCTSLNAASNTNAHNRTFASTTNTMHRNFNSVITINAYDDDSAIKNSNAANIKITKTNIHVN